MRNVIVGVLLFFLGLFADFFLERTVNRAPEWVARLIAGLFIPIGLGVVLLSDMVWPRVWGSEANPIVSTAIVAVTAAIASGSLWWFMRVEHTHYAQRNPLPVAVNTPIITPTSSASGPIQLSASTGTSTDSLKFRAQALSSQILAFLGERRKHEPVRHMGIPGYTGGVPTQEMKLKMNEQWETDTIESMRYGTETKKLYTQMFAVRGVAIVEELRTAGEYDPDLECEARQYTNGLVMESFARRLGAIAARLR